MLEIVPYLGAFRIMDGSRVIEQHGSKLVADSRLEQLQALQAQQAPKAAPKAAPAEAEQPEPAAPEAPATPIVPEPPTILDGTLAELAAALSTGEHDGNLAAILEAEQNGKTRKGALRIIESRMAQTNG